MSIAVTAKYVNLLTGDVSGTEYRWALLTVTGLTGGAQNTIPHTLNRAPVSVIPIAYDTSGTGAAVGIPSLDGSTVAAGFDATNIYVKTVTSITTAKFFVIF